MRVSNRKRVLVSSGAGFLGSHLCERLLADGCDVMCVDYDNPNLELMRHDVTFPLYVEVDEIYNLACSPSPPLAEGLTETVAFFRGLVRQSTTSMATKYP